MSATTQRYNVGGVYLPRPFKVPWPRFTCIVGALACAGMILALPRDTWIRLAVWTAIGFLIYGLYGRRRGRRMRAAAAAVSEQAR